MENNLLAQKNLETQLSLLNDIVDIDKNIIYDVNQTACKIKELLTNSEKTPDDKAKIITKENYEKIFDMLIDLTSISKFEKLGILSKKGIPERELKFAILGKLR